MKHTYLILLIMNLFCSQIVFSKNYMIYSMAQDIPMGDGSKQKKNYYINIGLQQGVKIGTELKVYRLLNRTNPYSTEKNVTFKVEVGELKVVHAEEENSIAELSKLKTDSSIFVEIPSLNIGDQVGVKTSN
jgi:hypothetical protein